MFKPVNNKPDFPEMETGILSFWDREQTFRKSLEQRKGSDEYVFYDGPPFATGLPHYGHLLAGTIKDIIPRYQTMRGRYVDRRFGWDCHGLPVEYEVEQDLQISGKRQIEELGIEKFNEKCRSIVLRYTGEWRKIVTRMGRWVDFDNDYKTMDSTYMESIWWVFKSLYDRGMVYKGHKILPYCPRCSTPLSNFEANQGYEDVKDPAITVRFKVSGRDNEYILAWTTTPWTLPSNMALAVGEDITYARIHEKDAVYYLAEDRLGDYYRDESQIEKIEKLSGSELEGLQYEPLFPYFAEKKAEGAFKVFAADFVSTEEGTGIVHIAPGFGEDDSNLGRQKGIPAVCPVDAEGRFTGPVSDYVGREVKEADLDIIKQLKLERKLVHKTTIIHSYPHCWRCDTALIYRSVSTWFVNVEQIKDKLLEANKDTNWTPQHIRDGRFGNWLEGARDWAISRNRFWGTPLPIWESQDGKEHRVFGSIEEVENASGIKLDDLHKHIVDKIVIKENDGQEFRRVPQVLDCWFESGAMPYAQAHYPFENKERFEQNFPADFIAEGLDQTRGWFYTLMVLSTALFGKPAFRNVVVNGLILAEDGRKMSKRLKNYPDPKYIIETYGADALRLYMISSPVVRAEDLRFSESGVREVLRHMIIPLWNAYSFFVTYANIDQWNPDKATGLDRKTSILDRWILSSLQSLSEKVANAMDSYDLQKAVRPFLSFIDDLTNWYIRRSRRRFWKSQDDGDKSEAYETLWHILLEVSRIAAPFIPFISESIYLNLKGRGMPDSVHLCDFPEPDESLRDSELESQMSLVMLVVKLGRLLRSEHNIKVRQPLARMHIVSRNEIIRRQVNELKDIALNELNVKSVEVESDETRLVRLKARPNFKILGPKWGRRVGKVAGAIELLGDQDAEQLADGKSLELDIDGEKVELQPDEALIERIPREGLIVASEGEVAVALETSQTEELVKEGHAREIVNRIQNLRKQKDLEVSQRIKYMYCAPPEIEQVMESFGDYIAAETLTVGMEPQNKAAVTDDWEKVDINGHTCWHMLQPAK